MKKILFLIGILIISNVAFAQQKKEKVITKTYHIKLADGNTMDSTITTTYVYDIVTSSTNHPSAFNTSYLRQDNNYQKYCSQCLKKTR